MRPEFIELSNYRLEKSKSDLSAAELLHTEGLFHQSLNRSYYSIFHATRALLALDEFDSKKHSGIIAYFNKNYINTEILGKEFSKILMGAERIRNKCDYDDFYKVSKDDALMQIEKAKIFIEAVENLINKKSVA